MSTSFIVIQFLNGLASAASLFIIASGLTIVFGVTRIVNFAHGSLYMLGAYFAVSILPRLYDVSNSFPMFIAGLLIAAAITGLIGVFMEVALLRRIYKMPELLQLLATFGVVLIVQDLVMRVWGPLEILGPRAPGLKGAVEIAGIPFPAYELFLIVMGPLVFFAVSAILTKTRFGVLVRAATQDREMVSALGVNQAVLFTGALFIGAFLAGLGGALQTPKSAASPHMDIAILTEAFVVTVIGGMGSVPGAAVAALLIGQINSFGIVVLPKSTLVLVFVLMAVVLILKPQGLFGKPEVAGSRVVLPEGFLDLSPPDRRFWQIGGVMLAVLAALPLVADGYLLKVMIEILIFASAAFALAFLVANGGIVSFGHAAYFGLGAYGAALGVKKLGLAMEPALVLAPIVAGVGAALFGLFIVRLRGIYLAMLTLAVAQIVYAIAFQWTDLTGGDNGIVGVWPSAWASSRVVYYYLTLVLSAASIALLLVVLHSPFGYAVRGSRDSATRAEAIGLDVTRLQWVAFTLAGAVTGLAGGLYAFSKGSIDPTLLSIPQSVDFLAMLLMGGVQAVLGSPVGAFVLHTLKDIVMPLTDLWRMLLGALILASVLLFPRGLAGAAERLLSSVRERGATPDSASARRDGARP
ncbi:MAG TPA: ABC transporter permease [Hyphomicrobiaceae bacterium]|nr:ABC transporter permease [Hyphomicrobiaceae bacterium]